MSTYYVAGIPFSSNGALAHHGIKGQKWGIRRFQNKDGSLTAEGKKRYEEFYGYNNGKWEGQKSREKADRNDEELRNRIGIDLTEKSELRFGEVLESIYDGDYDNYTGPGKKEYEKLIKQGEDIQSKYNSKYEEIYVSELNNIPEVTKMRRFLDKLKGVDSDRAREREADSRTYKKMQDTKEWKEFNDYHDKYTRGKKKEQGYGFEDSYMDKLRDKMATSWKNKSMDEILKSVPEDKRDDVWQLLRFEWWDYD